MNQLWYIFSIGISFTCALAGTNDVRLYIDSSRTIVARHTILQVPVVVVTPDNDYGCYKKTLYVQKASGCVVQDNKLIISGAFGLLAQQHIYVLRGNQVDLQNVYDQIESQQCDDQEPVMLLCGE